MARDFNKKGEKDREDLFSATAPLALMRYMLSRQATVRDDGQQRKTMYLDVRKAHLIPKCDQDVYVQLPPEAGVAVQLRRPRRSITRQCSVKAGFKRPVSCLVAFAHESRDLMGVVHGDDFVFVRLDVDLDFSLGGLQANCELQNRGQLGSGEKRSTCDGTIGA